MKMLNFQVRLEEKLEMFDHTQVAMKKLSAQVLVLLIHTYSLVCFAYSFILILKLVYFAGGRSEGAAWSSS